MNVVELLAVVRKCFEQQNPKVLIPKKFSKQKMEVLNRARKEVEADMSGATLINLTKIWVRMLSDKDDKAYEKCMDALKKLDTLPIALRRRLQKKQGEGQLRFTVESPAGPSRLCRVPFYPIRTENAWSSRFIDIDSATPSRQSFGIEELGDDPIINIGPWFGQDGDVAYQNSIKMPTIQLMTQKVEFGAYRLVGMEINAYFGSRYIGAIRDGDGATGSVEIVGAPAAATGTVEAVGPVAVAATGVLTVAGSGAAATGTVEFIGAPAAASGNITVNGDGDAASVVVTIPGGEALASATITLTGTAAAGDGTILFADGDAASADIRPNVVTIADGDQILLTSGGGATGLPLVSELYTARTVIANPNTEFQAGTVAVAMASFNTLINGLGALTAYTSAIIGPGTQGVTITTKGEGSGYNRARNPGSNIITLVGFTVAAPAQLEFSGGTDSVVAGTTIDVTDLTGATNTVTAVLSGSGAGANQFETFGNAGTTRDNVLTAYTALAIPNLAPSTIGKEAIRFTYTVTGFLPAASGVIGDPFLRCSDGSTTTTVITAGADVLDYGSVFTIDDSAGTSVQFAAQPVGTVVPGGFTAFATTNDTTTTATSLRAAGGASALALTFGGAVNSISIIETQEGRIGNNATSPGYSTPFGVGARLLVDVGSIAVFSAGQSPVADGTILTLTDTTGATYNITGTDGGAETATTFNTELGIAGTRTSVINAINLNVGIFSAANLAAPETFIIEQDILGTIGNGRAVSSTAVGQFTFSNPTFIGGADAVSAGETIQIISTNGVTETYTFVTAGAGGFNILSVGTENAQAANIANAINASANFSAVVNGFSLNQVDITQSVSGPAGNTIITVTGGDLIKTDFTGGAGVYPVGQNISITDVDGITELFIGLASGVPSATEFVITSSKSDTASSLSDAIGIRGLNITRNLVGDVLNLTQGDIGSAGNNPITPSSVPNVNITGFAGGTDAVSAGTTITVEDNTGAVQVFTGVAAAPGANQFDVRGSVDAIATSIASSVNTRFAAGPTLTSNAVGAVITFTQGSVGTVNNGRVLSSSVPAEIAETSTPFSGGVDNVSTGTSITLTDSAGVTQAFSAIIGGVPGPAEFSVDNLNPANTIANLAATVTGFPIDITGVAVGNTVTFTQGTNGPDGNTAILSSDDTELDPTSFSGGRFSVELGAVITITSTDGTVATFTAVDGATTATTFDVQPTTLDTLNNLSTAIGLSAINGKVTPVVADPLIGLIQVIPGAGGNIPITITNDAIPATLAPLGFAGGANSGLNLTNPLSPIAISVKELTVYNGNNILIVEDSESVSASEFNILNRSQQIEFSEYVFNGTGVDVEGQTSQPLSDENVDDGYKFIGFRDQPIVDPNSQVFVKVDAFITNLPTWSPGLPLYPANTPRPKIPPVSFSVNLVVDLLEDKVFGDSFAPSPASRAAANVKLSAREIGENRIVLSNSVVKKPEI